MDIKLRELLNASKEEINNKDKIENDTNKKIIDEYFNRARKNANEFYFAVIYLLFTSGNIGYVSLKTNNKTDENVFYTASITDEKTRLSNEDNKEIEFLKKHNAHLFPTVFAALNSSDNYLRTINHKEVVIYTYIESEKKVLPVLFNREDFEKIGFSVDYQNVANSSFPATISLKYSEKTLDNLVDGVLNKKENYIPFLTDKITATVKASIKAIDEYTKKEEIKEKTIMDFENKSLKYANELALEICKGIIKNYNPSVKTIDTEMNCSTRTKIENLVAKEDLQLFDEYQNYSSKKVVFFPAYGEVKNITYRPIILEQLRTVLEEIGTTFEEDAWFRKIYIHTNREKFVEVINEDDPKTK